MYSRRSNGSDVPSAARRMSRPPPISVSLKRSSFCTRRPGLRQTQRWTGVNMRSNAVAVRRAFDGLSVTTADAIFRKLWVAETAVGCIGCAVLAFAVAADQAWFDRHFLPTFFVSRSDYLEMYEWARLAVAIVGAVIVLLLRKPVASVVVKKPATA